MIILTDLTGDEETSLLKFCLIPSGVLLTLLTRKRPFFLVELLCLSVPDDVDVTVITGGTIPVVEDICDSAIEVEIVLGGIILKLDIILSFVLLTI